MKSMLHEASSVPKAIQKAWEQAGCPEEFTIRVLEVEKKGFAGLFVKSPAVVSIAYSPSTKQKSKPGDRQHVQKKPRSRYEAKDRSNSNNNRQNDRTVSEKKKIETRPQNNQEAKPKETPVAPKNNVVKKDATLVEGWSQEQVKFVEQELKQLNERVAITSPFALNTEKKILHVIYDGPVCERQEDERVIFISLSHLLMQYLKKNFKRKFRGYHILVSKKATT